MAFASVPTMISVVLLVLAGALAAAPPPTAGGPPKAPVTPPAGPPKAPVTPPAGPPKVPTPPLTGPPKGASPPAAAGPLKFPALLAFGDSVADTGNNNYVRTIVRANFPPYGKDFAGHKATGRFCDGKVSVDFLASALGVKELLPPYLKKDLSLEELKTGVSFASAGSGYDNSTCRTMSALTMERQLQMFQEYKAKVGGTIPDKTLYLLVWGSNDIVEHFTFADGITEPNYADYLVKRAISYIQSLVDLGAKRVALTGIPPVGCLPSQRMMAGGIRKQCATDRNQLSIMFNRKVSQEMATLNAKLPGVTLVYIDLYGIFTDMIERHDALGFKNGKDACCGYIGLAAAVLCNFASPLCPDPSKYIFWDSYHPTEAAYKVIIDVIVDKYFKNMH
ncbi:GDSL esterase/lipase EXL3-like [Lolium rigidum]|uniref:GDSL esterase/lipase EXL3-like n=1 Tax=Lolium rigidum TaxID=89674 RepID=UPI001F5D64D1|nr:GDSL esterase/lipase EXL3-like [Lolium rigidum]